MGNIYSNDSTGNSRSRSTSISSIDSNQSKRSTGSQNQTPVRSNVYSSSGTSTPPPTPREINSNTNFNSPYSIMSDLTDNTTNSCVKPLNIFEKFFLGVRKLTGLGINIEDKDITTTELNKLVDEEDDPDELLNDEEELTNNEDFLNGIIGEAERFDDTAYMSDLSQTQTLSPLRPPSVSSTSSIKTRSTASKLGISVDEMVYTIRRSKRILELYPEFQSNINKAKRSRKQTQLFDPVKGI